MEERYIKTIREYLFNELKNYAQKYPSDMFRIIRFLGKKLFTEQTNFPLTKDEANDLFKYFLFNHS